MKFLIIFFLVLNLISSVSIAQEIPEEIKQIMILENTRDTGSNGELLNYLHSTNPEIRAKAIYALANIGDSSVTDKLDFLLAGPFEDYPSSDDFKAVSFFLGQVQSSKGMEMIRFILNESANPSVKTFLLTDILETAGKSGDENDLEKVCLLFDKSDVSDSLLMRAYAMSIARFALRKIKSEKSVETLKRILNSSADTQALQNCAFAFWRTSDKIFLENALEEINLLRESEDAQTRMWAYNAGGKTLDMLFLLYTLESFNSEKDWRVKVNMLNAITNYNLDSIPELTLQLFTVLGDGVSDSNEHVSLTALNVLGKVFKDLDKSGNAAAKSFSENLMKEFTFALDSADQLKLSWRVKSEIVNSMSLIFRDEVKDILINEFLKTDDYRYKSGILKAFGNFNNSNVYKEIRNLVSEDVQRYNQNNFNSGELTGSADLTLLYRGFLDMLSSLQDKADEENRNIIRLIYTEFIASKDPIITDICFSALKDSIFSNSRDETNLVTVFDYSELKYPENLDVMLIFIDAMGEYKNGNAIDLLRSNLGSDNYEIAYTSAAALEKITGNKYEFSAKPNTDFDWEYLGKLSQMKFITVKTNKGNIKIELLPEYAPFTVMNFLKLSESNYFNGTVFHRVVSNFVIQGGDPTGTGYGGPGYSIRSEFSPLNFETGMVGMASSGKDTEGSQFFITHSATPHLDSKYTIFGKVTDGMDVVNEIMIGDNIIGIDIE